MSERRAFAADGMVRIIGPATVTGVQFYGLLPITDFAATSITAPDVVTFVSAGVYSTGPLANVDLTAGQIFPAMVTAITVPSGGEVWGLLAKPL